jgi:hypothetical protein
MEFEEYWNALNAKKEITGDIRMTPEQFKKIQRQAFDLGRKSGKEEERKTQEIMGRASAGNGMSDDSFSNALDALGGMFGGKP